MVRAKVREEGESQSTTFRLEPEPTIWIFEDAYNLQELLSEEKVIQGIPWSVLKVKKDDPKFDFKGFIDSLSKGDLDTLMECMQ